MTQFGEILSIAFNSIRANKLRAILTLLGIIVGVFSIIAVMTAVGVLQKSIETELSNLGAHTFQIQKYPVFHGPDARRRLRNRKNITLEQAEHLRSRLRLAQNVGFETFLWGRVVKSEFDETTPSITLMGENVEGITTNNWIVKDGRSFTQSEYESAKRVAILGGNLAKKLFPKASPLGREIRVEGQRLTVIGVFETKGGTLGGNQDNFLAIPLTTLLTTFGSYRSMNIMIQSKTPELFEESMEEARGLFRIIRKVSPGEADDFEIFSNDSLIKQFNDFTFYVKVGIAFISFIALVAAGVGIMNIMLVSVTERTREIGIRKAVGAQKTSILKQFIMEAMVLSQLGGIIGILLGLLGGNLAAVVFKVNPVIPIEWVVIGFLSCTFVGVVFGVYPAWKAANLDPIDALRYE